ncbi:alpha/beta hydrolase [Priestia megaterium]|uniref:alpha/beta hydrolase n=1 Tax=Priestia TaxID=2800373 RepID=UPI001455B325|nr:alpha/beta hydrolase [Priestia aryabhattai]NLR43406.1 alpha/beta hydrolase [Priestia megaterium]
MPLDPHIQIFLNQYNEMPRPSLEDVTPLQLREMEKMSLTPSKEAVKKVYNEEIQLNERTLTIRVYEPEGTGPFPALVYYHGGGWVLGSLDTHDSICRSYANKTNCIVVSVDYRLAPESKFPAAVNDAYDALDWISAHASQLNINSNKIAVGGDSAGGNLAAIVSILAKQRQGPSIVHQLLIYPSVGFKNQHPASMKENAEGYLLSKDLMDWFRLQYLNNKEEEQHPYNAPVLLEDLSSLPSATIITAQYDPLRDSGKDYADALKNHGVPVTYENYETMIHGFLGFHEFVPLAQQAINKSAAQLRQVFDSI